MLVNKFEKIVTPYNKARLTPMGYDLSVEGIFYLRGECELACKKCGERVPTGGLLEPMTPYVVTTHEVISMPLDCTGIVVQRSTLNRCGVIFNSAIIDAGYFGGLSFLLLPTLPILIKRGDRIGQLIVFKHKPVHSGYDGTYNNGDIPEWFTRNPANFKQR